MKIRQITPGDLPALAQLLTEGFPRRDVTYWESALSRLGERPQRGELPRYGLLLEHDGALQGVMLMIAGQAGAATFCNLSSWYVRPSARKYAALLFQRSLKFKDVTFTDCSPAPHVLPIIETFGFKPYTGGTLVLDARHAIKRGPAVQALDLGALGRLQPERRPNVEAVLSQGAAGLLVKHGDRPPMPLLFRTRRIKRLVPAAQFIYGDPQIIAGNAGPIMRWFLARGVPFACVDWPSNVAAMTGTLLPGYQLRHKRGPGAPEAGDLSDTELGVFSL